MPGVSVEVYGSRIQLMFAASGEIGAKVRSWGREAVAEARLIGPKRTGKLVAGLRSTSITTVLATSTTMTANAKYAAWVVGGTTGPIRSSRPNGWLRLPEAPGSAKFIYRKSVRGQAENPFMARAMESVLRGHGIAVTFPK